jgi:hypothetical protein
LACSHWAWFVLVDREGPPLFNVGTGTAPTGTEAVEAPVPEGDLLGGRRYDGARN